MSLSSRTLLALATLPLACATAQAASEQEVYEIARDAYVYAYPLVIMGATVAQTTNYAVPTGIAAQGPVNQFTHGKAFVSADFKRVVRPNVDTLYSTAVLDLGPEPMVLSVPASDRYFMLPLLSLWTDVFAVPGTRTTGANTARDFLVVAPDWKGTVPAGLEVIRSPTRIATIAGRTQTNGKDDYANVHRLQAQYKVTPLSAWGKADYRAPTHPVDLSIDMTTPPPVQVRNMDAAAFFGHFSDLLKDNPPSSADYPMIHRLERIGFKVGQHFDVNAAPAPVRKALERATADGRAEVENLGKDAVGGNAKGWAYTAQTGSYGVDYRYRAAMTQCCLGINLPQDASYPSLSVDENARPLNGNSRYVLHFKQGELPPVEAFWSLTAYDADGYFIPNPLGRQALGDRDKLRFNADGSLDLYIQADSPGKDKEPNWLPVASAPFTLMLRLYSPKGEVLAGEWKAPVVKRQKTHSGA
ncbi:DUF1254 domain-containing protein [Pseudomonas sp. NPDC090755]|uniref:DUF1254 domain-containing protein n=1 Tax=Pseudomonas sp. NPDC090755 TaxID=3364481 RepID=UPI003839E820